MERCTVARRRMAYGGCSCREAARVEDGAYEVWWFNAVLGVEEERWKFFIVTGSSSKSMSSGNDGNLAVEFLRHPPYTTGTSTSPFNWLWSNLTVDKVIRQNADNNGFFEVWELTLTNVTENKRGRKFSTLVYCCYWHRTGLHITNLLLEPMGTSPQWIGSDSTRIQKIPNSDWLEPVNTLTNK